MSQQTWIDGDTGAVVQGVIDDNFAECYAKQDALVSGTNIKTINSTSLLGSGDIAISGSVADGDKVDIVVSGSGATWTIDVGVVTYAKMQDVSAASKLLGRGDSGSGDVQEITLGSGLTMTGTTLSASGGGTVDSTIIDGSANAVAGNAVFDALALKANLAAPVITGAWDLQSGYYVAGMRAKSSYPPGVGFYDFAGNLGGAITVDNSGTLQITVGANSLSLDTYLRYGKFYGDDANGGAATGPLFAMDITAGHEGGFYCPASGGQATNQYWVSERTERIGVYRDGTVEFLAGTKVVINPASSATPGTNGNLVIEATSNTSLTFKYKGSDGTVRSGSITLS